MFGDNEIDGSSPYRQEVGIRRIVTHPDYVYLEQYDLAVIQLDSNVIITDYVRPVCLSNLTNEWEAYDNCWISGWGELNANGKETISFYPKCYEFLITNKDVNADKLRCKC